MLRQAQLLGHLLAHLEDRLGGVPERQTVALPGGGAAVRLQAVVQRRLASRTSARSRRRPRANPASTSPRSYSGSPSQLPASVQLRRVRLERGVQIDDERQRLVLDLDQPQGVLGDLFGVGGNRRDLVADEAHGLLKEDGCPCTSRCRARSVELRTARTPGSASALRGVDARDSGVRVRAAQDRRVELPRQSDVVGVARLCPSPSRQPSTRGNGWPTAVRFALASQAGQARAPRDLVLRLAVLRLIGRLLSAVCHRLRSARRIVAPRRRPASMMFW